MELIGTGCDTCNKRLSMLNKYKSSNNVSYRLNIAVVSLGSVRISNFEILNFKLNAVEFRAVFRNIH